MSLTKYNSISQNQTARNMRYTTLELTAKDSLLPQEEKVDDDEKFVSTRIVSATTNLNSRRNIRDKIISISSDALSELTENALITARKEAFEKPAPMAFCTI